MAGFHGQSEWVCMRIHSIELKAIKDETKKIYLSEEILGELFRIVSDHIPSQKLS